MNSILFKMEWRRNVRGFILWSLIICGLIFFTMSLFRSVIKYEEDIMKMIQIVPAAVIKARGFGNVNDVFSGLGFYSADNVVYMMLLGSIYSMVICCNIFLKEETGKTAEFFMSRPISRKEIFISKSALAFMNILLLNLIAALTGFIALEIFKTGDLNIRSFLLLTLYTLELNLLFGTFGLTLAVFLKRPKPMTLSCVGIILIFYFINTISRLTGVKGDFGYISPFKWANTSVLEPGYGPETWRISIYLGISAILIILSGYYYRRKDILA